MKFFKKFFIILFLFVVATKLCFAQTVQKWNCKIAYKNEMWINNTKQESAKNDEVNFLDWNFYYNPMTKKLYAFDRKTEIKNLKIIGEKFYFKLLETDNNSQYWAFEVDKNTKDVKLNIYVNLGYVDKVNGYVEMKSKGQGKLTTSTDNI